MTEPVACFFDLDGTLTDSKPGITRCIQFALERLGEEVPTADALEWCIGPPLQANFEKLIGVKRAAQGVAYYRERYRDVGLFENEVYPGVDRVLSQLSDRGTLCYVASSKPLVYVRQILEHFGLDQWLAEMFGSELDGRLTDKAELLAHAIQKTGIRPERGTMIGDRDLDAIGAKANGLDFVGALYGYGSVDELKSAGALRWVERPEELLAVL